MGPFLCFVMNIFQSRESVNGSTTHVHYTCTSVYFMTLLINVCVYVCMCICMYLTLGCSVLLCHIHMYMYTIYMYITMHILTHVQLYGCDTTSIP